MHKPVPRAFGGIPSLIKRNTWLFALSQSFVGAGTQLAYGIGPLMIVAVTDSAILSTLALYGKPVGEWKTPGASLHVLELARGADRVRHIEPVFENEHVVVLLDGTRLPMTRSVRELHERMKFG